MQAATHSRQHNLEVPLRAAGPLNEQTTSPRQTLPPLTRQPSPYHPPSSQPTDAHCLIWEKPPDPMPIRLEPGRVRSVYGRKTPASGAGPACRYQLNGVVDSRLSTASTRMQERVSDLGSNDLLGNNANQELADPQLTLGPK